MLVCANAFQACRALAQPIFVEMQPSLKSREACFGPNGSLTVRESKTLAFCFQRNCPITWTQQAEQPQWNMLSGWECVRRCYFSLACFQRRSVETHCRQADSLLIQDRRHVSDGLYLHCHIPSPRQWITPFTAQTGFDVPEQTLHSVCF